MSKCDWPKGYDLMLIDNPSKASLSIFFISVQPFFLQSMRWDPSDLWRFLSCRSDEVGSQISSWLVATRCLGEEKSNINGLAALGNKGQSERDFAF